jgi:hypothetical protein
VNTAPTGPNGKPAQSLDSAWSEAQGWFGSVFGTYKGKVNTIPGDTSSIAAMYAPRGLLVLDNSRIGELCSTCQHGASAAAFVLYDALGVGNNIEYNGGNASAQPLYVPFGVSGRAAEAGDLRPPDQEGCPGRAHRAGRGHQDRSGQVVSLEGSDLGG